MARSSVSDAACYEYFLWDIPDSFVTDERLHQITSQVCQGYKCTSTTTCSAVFYPYSDLKNTIKMDNGITRFRISDILKTAPEDILEALIHILIAKVSHRKPRAIWLERYHSYLQQPHVEKAHAQTRKARNRKILSHPQGKVHNLEESFRRMNQQYFQNALEKPTLSWSPKRSRRQLGYHDNSLNLIVISRFLDRRSVPEKIVDYIMYHELLHIVVKPEYRQGKRIVHSAEFKRRERLFLHYQEAIEWLKQKC